MSFENLNLNHNVLRAVNTLGYTEPTSIQLKCIPLIKEGKDMVGQSSTGSGKTAAFGLPLLEKIKTNEGLQALILTPTRELCVQVSESLKIFGKFSNHRTVSIFGGVSINPQIDRLRKCEIVVGTPGRILDHLERGTINFSKVKILVIDEADKMFEMGFIEDVEKIISRVPRQRQTLLFSATLSNSINELIRKHLHNPLTVKSEIHVAKHLLKQYYYVVKNQEKFSLLVHLLRKHRDSFTLIFCATRHGADQLSKNLKKQNINALAIHGGLTQNKRTFALELLKKEKLNVLVATDVAARGLDIRNVHYVYNYDVPKSSDDYTHRIGRTARAGDEGDAITLLSEKDYDNFNRVLSDKSLIIHKLELPNFERIRFDKGFDRREHGNFRSFGSKHEGPRHNGPRNFGSRHGSSRPRREEVHRPTFGSRGPSFRRR
jgi:ATP-dependent RNA helicase DeaD